MTFVLGWFASMVVYETRGLGIAVGIHFALDVLVFGNDTTFVTPAFPSP